MQLVTSANSIWPTAAPSVAYAQLGDLVEIMLHPKDAVFATCGFCQTLNRRGAARCRACGGSFLASDESEQLDADEADAEQSGENAVTDGKSFDRPEFSDMPALRSMLLLVLVPPIVMFLAFFAWNKLRVSDAGPVGLPDRSSIESVFTVPNASAQAMLPSIPQDERARHVQAKPEVRAPVERAAGNETPATVEGTNLAEIDAERDAQKMTPVRPRPVPSHQPLRLQANPVAACSGYSFIARAVCVNKSCAQPRAAQHAECREANRQRRIDESRRNPVLMG
ncbi:hypothetical protein [Variovorax sp. Sphag1AA]|uniref:hypothetical protein n=1 Tax=Variovorax sp. Sphag1AA TaxID=2587027 RepID=UPI00160AE008|nr:hypothetical protein [Variovorax sp. Sphag1AA]MBB3178669.1 hypothetical protein [Variovorax sp. Sphag1AA]